MRDSVLRLILVAVQLDTVFLLNRGLFHRFAEIVQRQLDIIQHDRLRRHEAGLILTVKRLEVLLTDFNRVEIRCQGQSEVTHITLLGDNPCGQGELGGRGKITTGNTGTYLTENKVIAQRALEGRRGKTG